MRRLETQNQNLLEGTRTPFTHLTPGSLKPHVVQKGFIHQPASIEPEAFPYTETETAMPVDPLGTEQLVPRR
jgi:hypothetical protein